MAMPVGTYEVIENIRRQKLIGLLKSPPLRQRTYWDYKRRKQLPPSRCANAAITRHSTDSAFQIGGKEFRERRCSTAGGPAIRWWNPSTQKHRIKPARWTRELTVWERRCSTASCSAVRRWNFSAQKYRIEPARWTRELTVWIWVKITEKYLRKSGRACTSKRDNHNLKDTTWWEDSGVI